MMSRQPGKSQTLACESVFPATLPYPKQYAISRLQIKDYLVPSRYAEAPLR